MQRGVEKRKPTVVDADSSGGTEAKTGGSNAGGGGLGGGGLGGVGGKGGLGGGGQGEPFTTSVYVVLVSPSGAVTVISNAFAPCAMR